MTVRIDQLHLDADLLPEYTFDRRTDAELIEPVVNALHAAIAARSVTAARIFAGRIFTRKSEQSTRPFGAAGTSRYESSEDDYFLEVGIRIPHYASEPVLEAITQVENLMSEQLLREARGRLEAAQARTAAARDDEARIQAEIDRLALKE